MLNIHLLAIDVQEDFCNPNGALYVKGAEKDSERLADLVDRLGTKIKDIHATLDSHHPLHIAHPIFWKDRNGNHPNPFTLINHQDVKDGVWTTTKPGMYKYALYYTEELQKKNRYVLCIWPPHCLIGSPGHNVFEPFRNALNRWTENFAYVDYVTKGSNIRTEHYSAVLADVPDGNDPSTQINTNLLNTLQEADLILLAGLASSHCVKNTIEDIVTHFNADEAFCKKVVLLKDCMSPVPGFESLHDELLDKAKQWKFSIDTSDKFLA